MKKEKLLYSAENDLIYLINENKKKIDLTEDFYYCLLSKLNNSKDNVFTIDILNYKTRKKETVEILLKKV